jgi:hexosaminidase
VAAYIKLSDHFLTADSALVGEYTYFVNSLDSFITNSTGQSIRIWGTFPPLPGATNVDTSVSIQHWEFYEANPYWDYIMNGYNVLNSDDAFYIVNKYSAGYPQELNLTRVFHGAPDGGSYAPYIFDTKNATNNPSRDNPAVLGHIAALWNDDGPNATTYSEAYYAWRNTLPALADKQWGGDLLEDEYASIFNKLHAAVPDQNLDRAIPSKSSTIVQYSFTGGSTVKDLSGNGYDATTTCSVSNSAVSLTPSCSVSTPLGSKGRNYTLSFSIFPTADVPGALFTGPDSALLSGNGTSSEIMLIAAGNAFALNYSLPLNTWTDASLIGRGNQTFFGIGNGVELEFLTKIGVDGEYFVWAPMAIEAPLATIGGNGFTGLMKDIKLVHYA